jgi:hypothetical protein
VPNQQQGGSSSQHGDGHGYGGGHGYGAEQDGGYRCDGGAQGYGGQQQGSGRFGAARMRNQQQVSRSLQFGVGQGGGGMEDGGGPQHRRHFRSAPMPHLQQLCVGGAHNEEQGVGGSSVNELGCLPEEYGFFRVYEDLVEDSKEHTKATFAEEKVRVHMYACLYGHF